MSALYCLTIRKTLTELIEVSVLFNAADIKIDGQYSLNQLILIFWL